MELIDSIGEVLDIVLTLCFALGFHVPLWSQQVYSVLYYRKRPIFFYLFLSELFSVTLSWDYP